MLICGKMRRGAFITRVTAGSIESACRRVRSLNVRRLLMGAIFRLKDGCYLAGETFWMKLTSFL